MSRGHQRVIATGHLGDAPVVKAPPSGGIVAEFRIAVDQVFKDRGGEVQTHTEWLRIKAFGRAAEIAQQYLAKGRLVTIEGKLHTEKWQADDGPRYSTWIYLDPRGLTLHGTGEHAQIKREHQGRSPPPDSIAQREALDEDDIPF